MVGETNPKTWTRVETETDEKAVAGKSTDLESFDNEIWRLESLDDLELPGTVASLKTKLGTRIFIVGTSNLLSS